MISQMPTKAVPEQLPASPNSRHYREADPAKPGQPEVNEKKPASGASIAAHARKELNVEILEASAEVSIKAGDQSQALIFRSALERINEFLAADLGPDAIQSKMSEDNSPEATAGRILSLSTALFDSYAAQRPDDDPKEVAKDFVNLIRGGFEKGFDEAKEILKGLKVFEGNVETGIMKTYELVQKGYDDFLAGKLAPKAESEEAAQSGAPAGTPPETGT